MHTMDTLEIIRQLQQDDALRAEMRAILLEKEVLELPKQVSLLTVAITKLEKTVGKLAENVGDIAESSCAAVLKAVAEMKGWTLLETPGPVDTGKGEVDVRGRFSTENGEVAVLAEAKSRLRGKDVAKWGDRVGDERWRNHFLYKDFNGQVLGYAYGTLIYADAMAEATRLGWGIMGSGR